MTNVDITALSGNERSQLMKQLCIERLERKGHDIEAMHKATQGDWAQTIYRLLLRYLVSKRNRVVAENLARIVPYSIIMRECGTLRGVEALIIGASGLLDECGESDYAKMLRQEFMHLAAKYNITPLKASAWSVDCITPYQHPLLHLAQLSALLHSGTITMSNILSSSTPESLKGMFGAQLSDFWCNHIGGAEPLAPRMGVTRRTILGINFVAPIIYTYGRTIGQHDYLARSLALLQALPAEDNRYTKQWSQHGITPTTALESQALIQLSTR
ncbi:MAG: DUF2851 family protein [Alistipes sp.]|nr:DUF2851 family protein [Alistipes sp.]